ncbi:glutathione S-transferase [Uliginosibacterium sp. H1]|uniref:glutathione S-transferase n=1 Tax=Uliginosibacterium sp. H1 TaxID=3114757 RepID=UPI002E1890C0|nr:glutathione S-transferase [Uliginosibacterium sp. H1]
MKLIGSTTSPYVRKVRILLEEKGLAYEFVAEQPWEPTTHVPDYNPLGKVPALVADDGRIWFDSTVVAEYIETLGAAPAFLPADPLARVEVRQLAVLADGIVDAGVAWRVDAQRPEERQDAKWIARQRGKAERGLDKLEQLATGQEWLHRSGYGLADVAAVCALGFLDFRHPSLDWRASRPQLTAYAERIVRRPAFAATIPFA